MDGTSRLFGRFIAASPPNISITPIPLPAESRTYAELANGLAQAMPDGDVIIIAESFSGPLAVALAERHHVAALIFCNSFVVAPRPSVLRWLLSPFLFKLPIPRFLLRRYMLGRTADEDLLSEVVAAIRSVPAAVLASRLTSVFQVDETVAFARCNAPTLYLRGTGDRLIPEAARLRMAAKRPIKTSHVPGPHLLLQANPAGAWKAIVEFLDSLPSPNP